MSGNGWFLLGWMLFAPPPALPSASPTASAPQPSVAAPTVGASAPTTPAATGTIPQSAPTAPAVDAPRETPMPKGLPPRPTVPANPRERIGSMVEPALWLVGALVLGAIGLGVLKRLQQVRPSKPEEELHAQLAAFRAAHLEGEMTTEEYEKVKAKLTPKIKELEAKPPAAQPPKGGPAT